MSIVLHDCRETIAVPVVLDSLPVGAMVLGEDLQIVLWNTALAEWTDIPASEAVGSRLDEFYPVVREARYFSRIQQALVEGTSASFSAALHKNFLPLQARHGMEDQLMVQETLVRRIQTDPAQVLVVIQDVTLPYAQFGEIKKERTALLAAQQQLKVSESKLRGIVDQSCDAVVVMTVEGVICDVNQLSAQLAGESASELHGQPLVETRWWRSQPENSRVLQDAMQAVRVGMTPRFELTTGNRAGQPFIIDYTLSPVRDEAGEIILLVLDGRDVTDQRISDALVRTAFESATSGNLMIDASQKIVMVNQMLCQLFGYEQDELNGQPITMLLSETVRADYSAMVSDYMTKPSRRPLNPTRELDASRKDGTLFPAGISLASVKTREGLHLFASVVDITDRKKSEAVLVEFAEQQQRLAAKLEASNEEMQQLLYAVSHDLKSPLVTIRGFAEMLTSFLEDGDESRARDAAARINRNAQSMSNLINAVLELSRVGRREMRFDDVDIPGVVDEALAALTAEIETRGARIVVGSFPSLVADRASVLQILLNLVQNALKYGVNENSHQIQIGAVEHDEEVALYVRDFGPGIPESQQQRVFRLFHRLKQDERGSGLGLATVAKIADRHGGRAWVESEPDQGATFWVSFPKNAHGSITAKGQSNG